jgi:hypothetical protein
MTDNKLISIKLKKNKLPFEDLFIKRANEFMEFLEIGTKYAPELKRNEDAKAERHPYHIVKPSPKPILASFILFLVIAHFLQFFHNF